MTSLLDRPAETVPQQGNRFYYGWWVRVPSVVAVETKTISEEVYRE